MVLALKKKSLQGDGNRKMSHKWQWNEEAMDPHENRMLLLGRET
jgi:hypothetical protein